MKLKRTNEAPSGTSGAIASYPGRRRAQPSRAPPRHELELAAQAILSATEFHDVCVGGGASLPPNLSLGRFSRTPIATRGIYFGEPEHPLKAPLILAATPLIPKAKRFVRTCNDWTRHSIVPDVILDRMLERTCDVAPPGGARGRQPKPACPIPCREPFGLRQIERVRLVLVILVFQLVDWKGHPAMLGAVRDDPTVARTHGRCAAFLTNEGGHRIGRPNKTARVLVPAGCVKAKRAEFFLYLDRDNGLNMSCIDMPLNLRAQSINQRTSHCRKQPQHMQSPSWPMSITEDHCIARSLVISYVHPHLFPEKRFLPNDLKSTVAPQ